MTDPGATRKDPRATRSAVVTMELERGVVGDLATLSELRDAAAERGTLQRCARLVEAARLAGVPVVHCIAQWRSDRVGTPLNAPLTRALARNPAQILAGSPAVELVPELGDTSEDHLSIRHHGFTPFPGTDLDPLLRSLDIAHVIVAGVSLNVGVTGLAFGAVDLGYEVTVAADAVVGVPASYGDDVLAYSVSLVAALRSVAEITSGWRAPS